MILAIAACWASHSNASSHPNTVRYSHLLQLLCFKSGVFLVYFCSVHQSETQWRTTAAHICNLLRTERYCLWQSHLIIQLTKTNPASCQPWFSLFCVKGNIFVPRIMFTGNNFIFFPVWYWFTLKKSSGKKKKSLAVTSLSLLHSPSTYT